LFAASSAALLRRKRPSTAAKTTHAANGDAVEAAVIVSVININAHRIEMFLSFDKGVGALAVSDQKKGRSSAATRALYHPTPCRWVYKRNSDCGEKREKTKANSCTLLAGQRGVAWSGANFLKQNMCASGV
jgi:hypothetical protein